MPAFRPSRSISARAKCAAPASSVSGTHTSVARSFVPGKVCGRRVGRVVARLPEPRAGVGVALVDDLGRALLLGDRLHELEVGDDELLAPGRLDEQARAFRDTTVPE